MATRPVSDDRNTREVFAGEALALFLERGYDGASLRDLAERVGVTSAALYYHYRSKHDLLLSIVCPFLDAVQELLEEARQAEAGTKAQRALLGALLDLMLEHRPVVTLLVQDVTAARQPGIGEQLVRQLKDLTRLLAGPGADEPHLIRASAAFGALRRPLVEFPRLDLAEHRPTILAAACGALGIRPGSARSGSAA